ncbi:MAG TPA: hypothetical protein VFB06_02385 [Streptosporangiaceae bacterium]|nr:hypothetical protein [Streptosporangiaceae bacterium]
MSVQSFGYQESTALSGPSAVVVPVDEYRRLRALERRATEADLDVAEADAIMQGYREWAAAGRPGAVSHEEVMKQLLGG